MNSLSNGINILSKTTVIRYICNDETVVGHLGLLCGVKLIRGSREIFNMKLFLNNFRF